MATSLLYYHNLIFWINFFVYWIYFLCKYLIGLLIFCLLPLADNKTADNKTAVDDKTAHKTAVDKTADYDKTLTCCCSARECKRKCTCQQKDCFERFVKIALCVIRQPVLIMFGKKLGGKIKTDLNGNKDTLSLGQRRLSNRATVVFFILMVTFLLVAVSSALNLTLLSITHICSEDPEINCYPQLIPGANGTGLNISIDEPIQDCTFWNSKGVSDRVTFECYQIIFNAELFFAIIGGLLAFCIGVVKIIVKLFHCLDKPCQRSSKCTCVVQSIFAIVASVAEVVVAVLAVVFGGTGSTVDHVDDTPLLTFLAMHTAEILLICGAVATLLWIPCGKFTKDSPTTEDGNENGGVRSSESTELQEK